MTIKKLTALLLAVAMLFTLAACDKGEPKDNGDTTTATTTGSNATTTTEDTTTTTTASNEGTDAKAFATGTINGDTYENTFLGIGCKVGEGWELSTAEDMREMNEMLMESLDEDYAEALKKVEIVYDMQAINLESGASININLENLGLLYGSILDESAYLDQGIQSMEELMGTDGVTIKKTTFTLAGKECAGLSIEMDMMGITIYEAVVCIKAGTYMGNVTVGGTTEAEVRDLLASFYAV